MVEALRRAQERGLVGRGDLDTQLAHSLGFVEVLRAAGAPPTLLDLGSGGGLPGLVVADALRESSMVLLESSESRCRLLRAAVEEAGWSARVSVIHERAEMAGHRAELRGTFDAVTSRSFGPPAVTSECGAPFLKHGGVLVVSEPPADEGSRNGPDPPPEDSSVRWPAEGLALLGLESERAVRARFGYAVLRQRGECPDRYARRPGVPAKRPLF